MNAEKRKLEEETQKVKSTPKVSASTIPHSRSSFPLWSWSIILLGCVGTIVYLFNRPSPAVPTIGAPPVPTVESSQQQLQLQRERFFDFSVAPVIGATHRENKLAADRCIARIDDLFNGYSEGTKPFVDDIMSFGSRWQALKNMGSDWWYEDDANGRMVSELFQKHYFTNEKLQNSMATILNDFRDEIRANQRKLLSEISTSAKNSQIPNLTIPSYELFTRNVAASLEQMSGDAVRTSVTDGITTLIVSEVGSIAVSQLVVQIMARFGTAAVTSAAAGGGSAMVGGAAAGGGGGAFGGPVGAAVGAGVGIAVGIVIDYFMTQSSKAALTTQMDGVLKDLKRTIISGNSEAEGLQSALNSACDAYNESVKSSLYELVIVNTGN